MMIDVQMANVQSDLSVSIYRSQCSCVLEIAAALPIRIT